jgi:SAM-dependent methyltransferase
MKPTFLKAALKEARTLGTAWMAEQTLEHLERIREFELEAVCAHLPASGRLLEIGAGAGWQARALDARGYQVSGIDRPDGIYRDKEVWPVTACDGIHIPFDDASFDIIYSSNTLEHMAHVVEFQQEIHRTLRTGGVAVHLLPSAPWRCWTNLTHVLKRWTLPTPHGELSTNAFSEIHQFSRAWWRDLFERTGWAVVHCESNHLFYTGHSVMDARLPISARQRMSHVLGGSCNLFVLREATRH